MFSAFSGWRCGLSRTLPTIGSRCPIKPDHRQRAVVGLMILLPCLAWAANPSLPGRVVHVSDGDSFVLDVRGAHYRIDLAGIDAPEVNQPWGTDATRALQRLTGAFVVAEVSGNGDAQVYQARVVHRQRDVALDLLHDGLAWSLMQSQPGDTSQHPYSAAEKQAREQRRGLWSDARPIPPWEWRVRRGPQPGEVH